MLPRTRTRAPRLLGLGGPRAPLQPASLNRTTPNHLCIPSRSPALFLQAPRCLPWDLPQPLTWLPQTPPNHPRTLPCSLTPFPQEPPNHPRSRPPPLTPALHGPPNRLWSQPQPLAPAPQARDPPTRLCRPSCLPLAEALQLGGQPPDPAWGRSRVAPSSQGWPQWGAPVPRGAWHRLHDQPHPQEAPTRPCHSLHPPPSESPAARPMSPPTRLRGLLLQRPPLSLRPRSPRPPRANPEASLLRSSLVLLPHAPPQKPPPWQRPQGHLQPRGRQPPGLWLCPPAPAAAWFHP